MTKVTYSQLSLLLLAESLLIGQSSLSILFIVILFVRINDFRLLRTLVDLQQKQTDPRLASDADGRGRKPSTYNFISHLLVGVSLEFSEN
jgi:hypothetical protein